MHRVEFNLVDIMRTRMRGVLIMERQDLTKSSDSNISRHDLQTDLLIARLGTERGERMLVVSSDGRFVKKSFFISGEFLNL